MHQSLRFQGGRQQQATGDLRYDRASFSSRNRDSARTHHFSFCGGVRVMSSRMCWRSASLTFLATVILSAKLMAIEPSAQAHMATFDKPTGETFFALSLSPTEKLQPAVGHDIVVLFDTSASQTGVYRDDAHIFLNELQLLLFRCHL